MACLPTAYLRLLSSCLRFVTLGSCLRVVSPISAQRQSSVNVLPDKMSQELVHRNCIDFRRRGKAAADAVKQVGLASLPGSSRTQSIAPEYSAASGRKGIRATYYERCGGPARAREHRGRYGAVLTGIRDSSRTAIEGSNSFKKFPSPNILNEPFIYAHYSSR